MTNYLVVGPSVGPEKRELVEELVHRAQIETNTKLTFWETEILNFIDDFRGRIGRVLTTSDNDYFKNKNIVLASAGPSLEGQIHDLRIHRENFVVCTVSRAARALISHGIIPDIIFQVDAAELDYKFYEGLDLSKTVLLSSTGTSTKITSLPFAEKFFFDVNQTLAIEMNKLCDIEVLAGFGGSVAAKG